MDLLTFLKRHEDTRKVFGQRELKIIEKQLRGINLTQSEKNRLSRDIRRKFAFMKAVAGFEEEFSLKKGMTVKRQIERITNAIREDFLYPKIKKIMLYGSVIENTLTFRSDIDIAVMFDDITVKEATLFRIRVMGKSPEKADVQVYNILPEKIKREINEKGRILYERKDTR
ncbi:nucleotidyltransferase domain-containing protein [Candidatus Woesearchaeota archaeon]|nr:nucleotidyltransferase domain-containing protein [Candidatus Woesearchaeota archaeon]